MIMTYVFLAFISGGIIGLMLGKFLTVRRLAARMAALESQIGAWQRSFK